MNGNNGFGKRLKQMREFKELTQSGLAQILMVSDKTVSKWENGGSIPDIDILKNICEYFSVSMDYLLSGVTNAITDVVSKIELACREDNIALLDGVDIKASDIYGHDIKFYLEKYDAKNVNRYYYDIVATEWIEENKDKENPPEEYYICALEKDSDNEDNLKLVKIVSKKENITKTCKDLEDEGYHGFKVFYEADHFGHNDMDYQYMSISFLNVEGVNTISLNIKLLNDLESAVAGFNIYKDGSKSVKTKFYVSSKNMKEFLKVLNEVDLKNWENRHWGYSIYNIIYSLKDERPETVIDELFYVNPGKDKYNAFAKAILKYIITCARPFAQKGFFENYRGDEKPYCREGLRYETSCNVFRQIEREMEASEDGDIKVV